MQTGVDFSQHVKEVLNRNNIQIRSLEFIDPRLREEFTKHRKKAILLIRNKVFEREINPLNASTIDVFDTQLSPYLKKGQLVLLVLPTGGVKRYVLQTSINNIFIDRFRLTSLDPRNSRRVSFSHPVGVRVRPVGDATVIRMQTGEIKAIRQSSGVLPDLPLEHPGQPGSTVQDHKPDRSSPVEVGSQGDGRIPAPPETKATETPPDRDPEAAIKDTLCPEGGDEPADDLVRLEEQTPFEAVLLDISFGGMCLSLRHEANETFFVDQLLAVECVLDKGSPPAGGGERVSLFLFAIVRNLQKDHDETRCNLQFLASLPKALQGYW